MQDWIGRQHMFFVATAPLSGEGLINCSPKGLDSFRILGPQEVAYLDLTGSGVETISHLRENGRIVFMFCSFEGPPKIVRLHGRGEALLLDTPEYEALRDQFPDMPGSRSIIKARIDRISDSCGYSIPVLEFKGDRDVLSKWAVTKGEEGVREYQRAENRESLDGLPGLD